jgi:hypothetical protein
LRLGLRFWLRLFACGVRLRAGLNFSETSLRRCGAIGALVVDAPHACRLDLPLFPLFAYLLAHANDNNARGCWALFTMPAYLPLPSTWGTMPLPNARSLYCSADMCVYASRAGLPAEGGSEEDGIAHITGLLNALLTRTTARILDRASTAVSSFLDAFGVRWLSACRQGALIAYEDINICAQTLFAYTGALQVCCARAAAFGLTGAEQHRWFDRAI